jgi:ribosome biogenesis GTPase
MERGRKMKALTGDEVLWNIEADGTAVISKILPRRTVLERIDSRGHAEGVAANVSLLAVVVAASPAPDWQLIDRYLVAAALMGIEAALIRNKADLADPELDRRAEVYRKIGYPVLTTSAKTGQGIPALQQTLSGQRSVLVGQSGVGKSSLLNALLATEAQTVGELSQRRALGRHTTTAAVLHRLPGGGELIDSPGVRRYAPNIPELADLAYGFIEFRPWLNQCRFNDCRHLSEPDCAVLAALARGEIDASRYQSYTKLRSAMQALR